MLRCTFLLLTILPLALPAAPINLFRASAVIEDSLNGFQSNFTFNVLTSQLANGFAGGLNNASTFAQANLRAGTIRVQNSGSASGSFGEYKANATGLLADTFTASGPLSSANFLANIRLTGSYSSSQSGGASYNDGSFFFVSFFRDGFFDDGDTSKIVQETVYAIGPDISNPFPFPGIIFGGAYPTFPATIPISIPFAQLGGSRFQVRIQLTTDASGDTNGGTATWNQNLANTLVAEFSATNGVTLQSEGGIAGTATTVPEPGTWALGAAGLIAMLRFRRK